MWIFWKKKIVLEKSKGIITKGYLTQDPMGFCTRYMWDLKNVNRHVWDDYEDERVVGEVLEGNGCHF